MIDNNENENLDGFDDTEIGPDYIISGDMMTLYGVNTPEKRLKMIETFEELKKL